MSIHLLKHGAITVLLQFIAWLFLQILWYQVGFHNWIPLFVYGVFVVVYLSFVITSWKITQRDNTFYATKDEFF